MARIIFEENIGDINLANQGNSKVIEADEKFIQALSFLLGWVDSNRHWTPILADSDGRLLVSTSPTKSNTGNHSNPSMSTTSATVLASNGNRKLAIIQNPLSVSVFLSFDGGAAVTTDFELEAGQTYIDDVYYGLITGILASGSGNLNVLELT